MMCCRTVLRKSAWRVTKILAGYRAVPKKRKPPKPAPVADAKPASFDDLISLVLARFRSRSGRVVGVGAVVVGVGS